MRRAARLAMVAAGFSLTIFACGGEIDTLVVPNEAGAIGGSGGQNQDSGADGSGTAAWAGAGGAPDASEDRETESGNAGEGHGGAAGNGGAGGAGGGDAGGTSGASGEAGQGGGGASGQAGSAGQAGVGGQAGSAGGGGTQDSGPPCNKLWVREICPAAGFTVSAKILGGSLVLKEEGSPSPCGSSSGPQAALKVYQSSLTGDFEVKIAFDSFSGAAVGVAFHAFVLDTLNDKYWAEASLTKTASGSDLKVRVVVNDVPQSEAVSTTSVSGTVTLRRAGGSMTVEAEAGGDSKSVQAMLGTGELRVGVGLQGSFNPPFDPVPSSVSVPSFLVTGGGGAVLSDTFDCDSIK